MRSINPENLYPRYFIQWPLPLCHPLDVAMFVCCLPRPFGCGALFRYLAVCTRRASVMHLLRSYSGSIVHRTPNSVRQHTDALHPTTL